MLASLGWLGFAVTSGNLPVGRAFCLPAFINQVANSVVVETSGSFFGQVTHRLILISLEKKNVYLYKKGMHLRSIRDRIVRDELVEGKRNIAERREFNRMLQGGRQSRLPPGTFFRRSKKISRDRIRRSPKRRKKVGQRFIPKKYYADVKNPKERKRAIRDIQQSRKDYQRGKYHRKRVKVKSFWSKESPHVVRAKKMFRLKSMKDLQKISAKTGCSVGSLRGIIRKGRGAFASSGSRPNQTSNSWAYARLASSISGGKAAKYDCKLLKQGHCNKKVMKLAAKVGCKRTSSRKK